MPSAATRAYAHLVTRTAHTLGVPLPAAFTAQLDAANKLIETAEAIPGPAQLQAAVLNALATGRDYHTDKEVGRLLIDGVLVSQLNIVGAARQRAESDYEDALVEHADTILTGWSDALEPHAKALAAAADTLPTTNLDDTQTIISRGAVAMHHWAAAQEAIKAFRTATEGFMALAMTNRITVTKRNPLILTAADHAALGEAEATAMRDGVPIDAWLLARHTVPLRLATLSEFMQRTASRDQQRREAARRFEEKRGEAGSEPSLLDA